MIALSTAPMPMNGMEDASAMEKADGCGASVQLGAERRAASVLTAASNSDLQEQH